MRYGALSTLYAHIYKTTIIDSMKPSHNIKVNSSPSISVLHELSVVRILTIHFLAFHKRKNIVTRCNSSVMPTYFKISSYIWQMHTVSYKLNVVNKISRPK